MKIKCLVENTTNTELESRHGLCFYVETKKHKILFDLGPDKLFIDNAEKLNIDLTSIDTVIISHGHIDHGGGLSGFLKLNNTAKIYIQKSAFDKYYSKVLFLKVYIGLDKKLINDQFVLLDGNTVIDEELSLFVSEGNILPSPANNKLYKENNIRDDFKHEHNLLIKEDKNVLFTGCSHSGIFNILNSCKDNVDICIGGFHLFNPISKKSVMDDYLILFSNEMANYKDILFYTCHCTGVKAFNYLSQSFDNIKYISCGNELEI